MKVAILSGSVYGTAEEVARHAMGILNAAGFEAWHNPRATLADVQAFAPDAFLAVTSTTGMGELPDNLMPLYSTICDQLPAAWRGLPGAVIGLGDAVPALPVSHLDGSPHALGSQGRPMLINYWASWCPPCIEEMPLLDAFADAQGEDGVRVIGIALDDPDAATDFLARHPVGFPVFLEESSANDSSALLGNVRSVLPYSVLIGADGRLKKRKMGAFQGKELEDWAAD